MAKNIFRTGKQTRPKTAVRGQRYRCAVCRKRSPKPVKTPAPWYCPICLRTIRREGQPTPWPSSELLPPAETAVVETTSWQTTATPGSAEWLVSISPAACVTNR